MQDYEALRWAVEDGIARVTLARPAKGNAIDMVMRRDLRSVVRRVAEDPAIKAVVLAGEGANFCTGGDLAAMRDAAISDGAQGRERLRSSADFIEQLILLEKPLVAVVQGHAAGAGCGLALAADFILAAPDARFTLSFARVGLVPDFGLMYTLPRLVGLQRAKELVFSARPLEAADALRWGLVYDVVEAARLAEAGLDLARRLATGSPAAFGLAKQALNRSFAMDVRTMLEFEAAAQGICFTTPWHREAVERFLDKKPSPFEGIPPAQSKP